MAEGRLERRPGSYPPEAQASSRLTAAYAAGSTLAMALAALGIVVAWPTWWRPESASAGRPAGWSSPQFRLGRAGEEPSNARVRTEGAGSRNDPAASALSRKALPAFSVAGARSRRTAGSRRGASGGGEAGQAADPDAPTGDEEAASAPQGEQAGAGEGERTAALPDGDAAADEIEATARRARTRVEAQAEELETRAEDAYAAAEEAFSRGQLSETALDRAREVADQARDRAEALRAAAEAAEERELERARRLRDGGDPRRIAVTRR